jgi:superfamily I DNA/RNA helicase
MNDEGCRWREMAVLFRHAGTGSLEFPVVGIPRLLRSPTLTPEEAKEEARLAYVAMTRATERLIVTTTTQRNPTSMA